MLVAAFFCVGVSQLVSLSLKYQAAKTPPGRKVTITQMGGN